MIQILSDKISKIEIGIYEASYSDTSLPIQITATEEEREEQDEYGK